MTRQCGEVGGTASTGVIFQQQCKENKGDDSSGGKQSEFKIALAAMTTLEDFQALQEQFADLKE